MKILIWLDINPTSVDRRVINPYSVPVIFDDLIKTFYATQCNCSGCMKTSKLKLGPWFHISPRTVQSTVPKVGGKTTVPLMIKAGLTLRPDYWIPFLIWLSVFLMQEMVLCKGKERVV